MCATNLQQIELSGVWLHAAIARLSDWRTPGVLGHNSS